MRLNFTTRVLMFSCSFLLMAQCIFAQDFTQIFKSPEQDAQTYLNNYVGPGMLSFANGMAGGWYNTAKPHKTLGIDLTFTLNMANIPSSERNFLFQNSDYSNLQMAGGTQGDFPTIVGGNTTQQLSLVGTYTDPRTGNTYTYTAETFDAPEGFDVEDLPVAGVPVPMLQLGIGLIKNTDIKLRFGKVNSDDYSVNLFGIGLMHDFKQWIPGIKHIPIDMSAFVGFSRFKATVDVDENQTTFTAQGEGEMTANTTTMQLLVSKKLAIVTPYFGVGYNAVSSSFKVKGTFTNNNLRDTSGNPFTLTDPVDLTFDGGSGLRTTLGLRIKLAIFTLHADYTLQKYNMLTAGVGLSFR